MSHTTQEDLAKKVEDAKKQVEVGAKYHHYKNRDKHYLIVDVGILEATEEVCVVYKALYDANLTWVRTLDVFLETVEHEGSTVSRFCKVD